MKGWRPHIDLDRLTAALSEDILAAGADDVRAISAGSGYSLIAAAQEVRHIIDAVSGDPEVPSAEPLPGAGMRAALVRRQ